MQFVGGDVPEACTGANRWRAEQCCSQREAKCGEIWGAGMPIAAAPRSVIANLRIGGPTTIILAKCPRLID